MEEGRRIRSSIPMDAMSPFIMTNRTGSSNTFFATVDVEKCEQLIRKKRAEGMAGLGMVHFFMSAYVRVVSQFPGVNRYIRGQRLYARNGIEICMAVKKELKLNAPETVLKLNLNPQDTLPAVYSKLNELISENKCSGDQNNMDHAARILVRLPGLLLKFGIWFLKCLDYFGLLPRFLTKLSPFHGSLFITNMGSLGMPPIVHHLYDFGNLPLFIAMGNKRTEYEVTKEGNIKKCRLMDYTVVCDERICDGHYYATAFKKFQKILEQPEQLFQQPEIMCEDIR